MSGAEFLGKAWVRGRLFRVDWYPGLVVDNQGRPVVGELYRVSPQLLGALDEFEGSAGSAGDEFVRVRVGVALAESKEEQSAWVWEYRGPLAGLTTVRNEDWLECD